VVVVSTCSQKLWSLVLLSSCAWILSTAEAREPDRPFGLIHLCSNLHRSTRVCTFRNSHGVYFSWVKEHIWVPGTGIDICGAWICHHRLRQHWAEAGPEAELRAEQPPEPLLKGAVWAMRYAHNRLAGSE
jgi:hypothetical protein